MKTNILNNENKVLGSKITQLRLEKSWSQEELAKKLQLYGLDISRATLSKIELGTRQVYFVEIKYFAKAFEIDLVELIKYLID